MNPNDIECQLSQIGTHWPVESVAESVLERLKSVPISPITKRRSHRIPWTVVGSALILVFGCFIAWTTIFVAPASLAAQVKNAIGKAASAHIVMTSIDSNGQRGSADFWYSRQHGIRCEFQSEIIVDDGKQQWTWNPTTIESNPIVERRSSRDAINMISEMMQLESIPAGWRQSRASTFDREIHDQQCEAYLVDPPANITTSFDGGASQSRFRFIVWLDLKRRVVRTENQVQAKEDWATNRESSIEYDIAISPEKFAINFPPSTKMIDADQRWANRFPLEKSLAKAESGGLLFAVHEVVRCEQDLFYIVSSVRGTAQHLIKYPPKRRRLNLHVIASDVASQTNGPSIESLYKSAILCGSDEEGVNYLWWIAVPRKFYRMKDGVRKDLNSPSRLEIGPGRIRIPLSAYFRDGRVGKWGEKTAVEVDSPQAEESVSLEEVARRCLADAALDREGLFLYGAVTHDEKRNQDQPQRMMSTGTSEANFSKEIRNQIDWLDTHDELKPGNSIPGDYDWMGPPIQLPRKIDGRVIDVDDTPVANAKVTVEIKTFVNNLQTDNPKTARIWTAVTDEQGRYEFSTDELQLGSHDVLCITTEANGYSKLATTDYERQVEYGSLPIQRLPGRRTIQGRIVDQQGNAVTKTFLRIWAVESPMIAQSWCMWESERIAIDDQGAFSVVIPKDGKALIEIRPAGFVPQVLQLPDGDTDLGEIQVEAGISLTGRVVDSQGKGVAGTVVAIQIEPVKTLFEIFQCPSSAGAKTDEDGKFTLPPFRGTCKVWVTDEAREYDGVISVNATRPNSVPVETIELTGKEMTKEIILHQRR